MGLSPQIIAVSGTTLEDKVGPFIVSNIKNVDI